MERSSLPEKILSHLPWDKNSSSLWPLSSFTLRRNISGWNFPSKLSKDSSKQIFDLVSSSLKKMDLFSEALVIDLSKATQEERIYVFEHFFLADDMSLCDIYQALIISPDCTAIVGVNLSDHLIIHCIDSKNTWHETLAMCFEIEKHLSKDLEFSFSKKYGYLLNKPSHTGLGLFVKAYLHLPLLIEKENTDLSNLNEDSLIKLSAITPHNAEEQSSIFHGDLLVLEANVQLGVFKEQVLKTIYKEANRLVDLESSLRIDLKSQTPSLIKDKISRAYGLLKHGYQIPTSDALESLSYLKLGIDLGFVEGIEDYQINDMFFVSRRSHLLSKETSFLSQDELSQKRAQFFHEKIQNANLRF